MKNAHERFGQAEFEKRLKDTTTRIRLTADCFIGEQPDRNSASMGHLLSVFGTDVEVAAVWAAVLAEEADPSYRTESGAASSQFWRTAQRVSRHSYGSGTAPACSPPGGCLQAFAGRRRPSTDHRQGELAGGGAEGRRKLSRFAALTELG